MFLQLNFICAIYVTDIKSLLTDSTNELFNLTSFDRLKSELFQTNTLLIIFKYNIVMHMQYLPGTCRDPFQC